MPSIHGEDAVLRILDKQRLSDEVSGLRLESLGFDAPTLFALRRLAPSPTACCWSPAPPAAARPPRCTRAIGEINTGHDKIITIEDPVEYQLAGVLQIPVNEKKGLTFARGLRSILRHDPDKIMVGEIRDGETAQIAVQAALTGHLVLTTVHANNVFDVLGRFMHMGLDPYSLVAASTASSRSACCGSSARTVRSRASPMPPCWRCPASMRPRSSTFAAGAAAATAAAAAFVDARRLPRCCCWTTSCAR
jgi:general secretion pathway protein E